MHPRIASASVFLAVVGIMAAVPAGAAPPAGSAPEGAASTARLTIYHWWISPSESAALCALVERFQQKHPGVKVYAEQMGRGGVRWGYPILKQLVVDKRPLDAF